MLLDIMHKYAAQQDIQLNPHKPTLLREIDGLLENLQKFGYLYCPCRIRDISGDLFRDKKISCPCAYHKRELEVSGFCKCELFIKPLSGEPTLVSTSIHRLDIIERLSSNLLEVTFSKDGLNRGEVKVFVPHKYEFISIEVETEHNYEISEEVLKDQILFFIFSFTDFAKILVQLVRV
ncbi:MAG TPA: hypothetical protein G4N92_05340 [Anaerolineae bacterium]|nr:hypothetical protein [Anaerolineae bacterium]